MLLFPPASHSSDIIVNWWELGQVEGTGKMDVLKAGRRTVYRSMCGKHGVSTVYQCNSKISQLKEPVRRCTTGSKLRVEQKGA